MNRRYSITLGEGEIIILAITALEHEFLNDKDMQESPYWTMEIERAKILREKLRKYSWTVDKT